MKHVVLLENIHGDVAEICWYGDRDESWEDIGPVVLRYCDFGTGLKTAFREYDSAEEAYKVAYKRGYRE